MGRKPKKKDIAEYLWHSEPTKINATKDNRRIRYGNLDSEGQEHQTTETVIWVGRGHLQSEYRQDS